MNDYFDSIMYAHHVYALCLLRSEEGVRSHGGEIIDGCKLPMWVLGLESGTSERTASSFRTESSLQPHGELIFFFFNFPQPYFLHRQIGASRKSATEVRLNEGCLGSA